MVNIGENFFKARTKYNKHGEETPRKVYAETGVTASSIELYESNKRLPNMENALILAKHYGVNVLYLLGESESWSRDEDSQMVTKMTGLSTETVEQLRSMRSDEIACLNALLTSYDFKQSLLMLAQAWEISAHNTEDSETAKTIEQSNLFRIQHQNDKKTKYKVAKPNTVSNRQLIRMYRNEALQDIGNAFRAIAPVDEEERKGK